MKYLAFLLITNTLISYNVGFCCDPANSKIIALTEKDLVIKGVDISHYHSCYQDSGLFPYSKLNCAGSTTLNVLGTVIKKKLDTGKTNLEFLQNDIEKMLDTDLNSVVCIEFSANNKEAFRDE